MEGYCDVALGKQLSDTYSGHLRFIIFCRCGEVVHPLHCGAHKLTLMAESSATAEIPPSAETADVLQYFQALPKDSYYTHAENIVKDSKSQLNDPYLYGHQANS